MGGSRSNYKTISFYVFVNLLGFPHITSHFERLKVIAIFKSCKELKHFLVSVCVQFNKMSHNCAGWSVLGVVGEGEDLVMDYIREEEEDPGYNLRPADRLEKF